MREILFRAYIKDIKKIVDVYDINFLQETIGFMNPHNTQYTCRKFNEVELMQYTGLKDKKGTKIFEGDVVKFNDYDSYDYECFETAGVVMYGGNMFYVTNRYSVNMEDLVDDLENTMECEVIGNIYDNPELFEVAE